MSTGQKRSSRRRAGVYLATVLGYVVALSAVVMAADLLVGETAVGGTDPVGAGLTAFLLIGCGCGLVGMVAGYLFAADWWGWVIAGVVVAFGVLPVLNPAVAGEPMPAPRELVADAVESGPLFLLLMLVPLLFGLGLGDALRPTGRPPRLGHAGR